MNGQRHTTRLVLTGVAVSRGGRAILAGVDLALGPGDVVLLKGANGSGKTTLLRAIAGLAPIEGEILPNDPDERRRICVYCGHADGVKGGLCVSESLAFWSEAYGADGARAAEAVAALGLDGLESRRAGILSAGQKRRLGLARLVIADKPIWLLDEPSSSIDAASSERLIALVLRHAADGGAALIATHDRLAIPGARSLIIESPL